MEVLIQEFDRLVTEFGFVSQNNESNNYVHPGENGVKFIIGYLNEGDHLLVSAYSIDGQDNIRDLIKLWMAYTIEDIKILFSKQLSLHTISSQLH